jgi:hypothetical protein
VPHCLPGPGSTTSWPTSCAEVNRSGWAELEPTFAWIAGGFTRCTSLEYEIVAAGPAATTVFRREQGERRVVHRHGDSYELPS